MTHVEDQTIGRCVEDVVDGCDQLDVGTQTGGSVLRPSAYCGIIGYKPTFGTFNIAGVKPAAQSLDTLGLHVRDLDDIALLTAVLVNRAPTALAAPATAPAIGLCRTPLWDVALPETQAAVEDAASRLAQAGATVHEVAAPDAFGGLDDARIAINCYERSRHMTHEWRNHRDGLSDVFQDVMQTGLDMTYGDYVATLRLTETCREQSGALFDGRDVLLAPCVDGEAPAGLDYSGNPRLQAIWTAIRLPTISLPTHTGPSGLPVGIQLVGRYRDDDRLLAVAKWVLGNIGSPTLG